MACGTLLAAAGVTPLAARAEVPLTLESTLHEAELRSRQLPAQDAAAQAAREPAAAGRRPDPVIKGSLSNLPIDRPDRLSITRDFMTMRSIGVEEEFTREDERVARSARFQREAELAQAGRVEALADLQRDAAIAWLELHYRDRMRELVQAQRVDTLLQVKAADANREGAALRVRPEVTTVAVILAGLFSIMRGTGTGSEVMQRIATPMVGGMNTAPLLSMFVIPAVELLTRRRREPKVARAGWWRQRHAAA